MKSTNSQEVTMESVKEMFSESFEDLKWTTIGLGILMMLPPLVEILWDFLLSK